MLPKSSKHYILPTANDLDLDPELVGEVVSFYYAFLRKTLSGLKSPLIQVENLGLFRAKGQELPKLVAKYEQHLKVLNPETFNQMAVKKEVEKKLKEVVKLQKLMNAEKERKREFLEKKNGIISKNMGSQETDSGGCEEQSC